MISGRLTKWDTHTAMELASPGWSRSMWVMSLAPTFGGLLWLVGQHPLLALAGTIASGFLISKISRHVTTPAWLRRNMMTHPAEGHQLRTYTYTWDDEALACTTEDDYSRHCWVDHVWLAENEDVLLLFYARGAYAIFPKTWFRDQAQLDEFRTLAATCLPGALDPQLQSRDRLAEALPFLVIIAISLGVVCLAVFIASR